MGATPPPRPASGPMPMPPPQTRIYTPPLSGIWKGIQSCINHPLVDATARCYSCDKPLCDRCRRDAFRRIYCADHAPASATASSAPPSGRPARGCDVCWWPAIGLCHICKKAICNDCTTLGNDGNTYCPDHAKAHVTPEPTPAARTKNEIRPLSFKNVAVWTLLLLVLLLGTSLTYYKSGEDVRPQIVWVAIGMVALAGIIRLGVWAKRKREPEIFIGAVFMVFVAIIVVLVTVRVMRNSADQAPTATEKSNDAVRNRKPAPPPTDIDETTLAEKFLAREREKTTPPVGQGQPEEPASQTDDTETNKAAAQLDTAVAGFPKATSRECAQYTFGLGRLEGLAKRDPKEFGEPLAQFIRDIPPGCNGASATPAAATAELEPPSRPARRDETVAIAKPAQGRYVPANPGICPEAVTVDFEYKNLESFEVPLREDCSLGPYRFPENWQRGWTFGSKNGGGWVVIKGINTDLGESGRISLNRSSDAGYFNRNSRRGVREEYLRGVGTIIFRPN